MFQPIDFNEWQFVTNQTLMTHPLDAKGGSFVDLCVYAEKKVRLFLVNTESQDKLLVAEDDTIQFKQTVVGFDQLQIRTTQTNDYAVKLFVSTNATAETVSSETAVMLPQMDYDQRIDIEVQKRLITELAAQGLDQDHIVDILEGLNADDSDLEFDDDIDLPTEAEMDELIAEARNRPVIEDDIEDDANASRGASQSSNEEQPEGDPENADDQQS